MFRPGLIKIWSGASSSTCVSLGRYRICKPVGRADTIVCAVQRSACGDGRELIPHDDYGGRSMKWFSILGISLANNLDNAGIGVAFGLAGMRVSFLVNLWIALLTFVITLAATAAG